MKKKPLLPLSLNFQAGCLEVSFKHRIEKGKTGNCELQASQIQIRTYTLIHSQDTHLCISEVAEL